MRRNGILEEFSGHRAKQMVGEIIHYHRIVASTGMTEAARYVVSMSQQVGLTEVELKEYTVDGHSKWWTWRTPFHWTAKTAELRMLTPQNMTLARFPDIPCSLASFSGATPPEGITAEVVDIGRGLKDADYEGIDVKDKIVLLSGLQFGTAYASRLAGSKGAIGIIFDNIIEMPPTRTLADVPEIVGYNRVQVADDRTALPGFSINHKQMCQLRGLLSQGPVTVQMKVDSEIDVGTIPVVTGVIRGSTLPDEEVLFIAHLCHPSPSANDNASGSALLLELARTYTVLIEQGMIAPPKRTLRFMWVPEFYGTIAYLHENEAWASRVKAVLCADMVGEDQITCGGPLVIEKTPDSLPSFLNDLVERFLERIPQEGVMYSGAGGTGLWKFNVVDFGGGSDHAPFVDRSFSVPSIMFGHWPDLFYHSSEDTLDKVDPNELEKVAWAVSEVALAIANAGKLDTLLFAEETFGRGLRRLHQQTQELTWHVKSIMEQDSTAASDTILLEQIGTYAQRKIQTIQFRLGIEQAAIASVLTLVDNPDHAAVMLWVESLQRELEHKTQQFIDTSLDFIEHLAGAETRALALKKPPLPAEARELQQLVPQRKWKGPLNIYEWLFYGDVKWLQELVIEDFSFYMVLTLIPMWIDNTSDLWTIAQRIQWSIGRDIDLTLFGKFVNELQAAGWVEFKAQQ